ncbi:hypothetical protein D3C71_1846240 [compost metagenome]
MFGDPLLEGFQVETLHALSGAKDVARFKLNITRSILTYVDIEGAINIPHIAKYSESTESSKRALYYKYCGTTFDRLDTLLKLGVR